MWLNDGGCVRLRPQFQNPVRSYDFVHDRTADGRAFRMLVILDEYTRECLAIDVSRKLNNEDVLHRLSDLFIRRGAPKYTRSDNGPEFTASDVRRWLKRLGVQTLFIERGSHWENGCQGALKTGSSALLVNRFLLIPDQHAIGNISLGKTNPTLERSAWCGFADSCPVREVCASIKSIPTKEL